jgi:hypothetical protein
MKKIVFYILLPLLIGCISPPTKTKIIETDRKVIEKTFNYIPETSDIDVRFEIVKNDLVGKLYRKEKISYKVSKKEVKSFDYNEEGEFKNDYRSMVLTIGFASLGLMTPFLVYGYYSEKFSLGEKRKFEKTEVIKENFGEFNSDLFQEEMYATIVNEGKKIKIKDSTFSIPLDFFIKRKDEAIEYKIYYQDDEVKLGSIDFDGDGILGTSPKFKQLLAIVKREQKKKEVAEEKERIQEEKSQSCEDLKIGWESHYSNASPSDYLTICNYLCARTCRNSNGFGTSDYRNCNSDCKNNCKTCFK